MFHLFFPRFYVTQISKTLYFAAKPSPDRDGVSRPAVYFAAPYEAILGKVQQAVYSRIGHHQQYAFLELEDIVNLSGVIIYLGEDVL